MKAPCTDKELPVLVRLYCLAIRLYPASFRSEFAEEMQVIFYRRLEDADRRGRRALLGFACKEALTLPSGAAAAHAQARKSQNFLSFILELFNFLLERGSKMSIRRLFPKSVEQTPWSTALLSLAPFFLIGPLTRLLSYHPWWDPDKLPFVDSARLPITVSMLALGFLIGILKQFPRWSYLYSLFILFILPIGVINLINRVLFTINPDIEGYVIMLLIVLEIIACRFLPFLRMYFANIRQDWTLLSYSFYAGTFFLVSTNDKLESPVYNLQVILPSLITWLSALAYLRLGDPLKKVGALLGAALLGSLIWWWPVFDGNSGTLAGFLVVSGMLLLYWLILGGLILAPILINIAFRPRVESTR
jgi:hypothetical protein